MKATLVIIFFITSVLGTVSAQRHKDDSVYLAKNLTDKPQFTGGQDALGAYTAKNIHYSETLRNAGIGGRISVGFTVDKKGKISDVKINSGVNPELDEEAIRFVKSMPPWKPAELNGVVVKCRTWIPITFTPASQLPPELQNQIPTLESAGTPPEYPGGPAKLQAYLIEMQRSIKFPTGYTQVTVYVQFWVNEDGTTSDFSVLRPEKKFRRLEDEVVASLKYMPKWKPSMRDGVAVRSQQTLAVRCKNTKVSSGPYGQPVY